jgi:2-enoate reductase
MMLLDLLAFNRVNLITGARVQEVNSEGIIAIKDSNPVLIEAETIVLASGLKSEDGLYQALSGKIVELYAIGDCREPRNIMGAIWDGYEVARAI